MVRPKLPQGGGKAIDFSRAHTDIWGHGVHLSSRVRLTREAAEDLAQWSDVVLERKLQRHDGDLQLAEKALQAIKDDMSILRTTPFTCRKAGHAIGTGARG